MWIASMLARWCRHRPALRKPPPSTALRLEPLDGRLLPSFLPPISNPDLGSVVAVGDFNNDHIADVVCTNSPFTALTLRLGVGDGTFHPPVTLSAPIGRVAVGDFNNDGDLDLVTVQPDVNVLLGRGDGTFGTLNSFRLGHGEAARDVAVGDFNGDGKLDLAVSGETTRTQSGSTKKGGLPESTIQDYVHVFLSQGNGTFVAKSTTTLPQNQPAGQLLLGDFNGDHRLDVIYSYGDGLFTEQLGNGDGTLQAARSEGTYLGYGVEGLTPSSQAAGDFNGDGITDFVTAAGHLFLGTPDGAFQAPTDLGISAGNVLVTDVNQDGKFDLVFIANVYDANGHLTNQYDLNVRLGNGDGTFRSVPTISLSGFEFGGPFAAGDFNGDGYPDLLIGSALFFNDRVW
jgi:hypothetical protein